MKTNKRISIENWMPAVITGIFGIMIGLLVTLFEAGVSDNRFFLEKQATTADRVVLELSRYVENWRKITKLKSYVKENNRKPTSDEIDKLKIFVSKRDLARENLFSALDSLHLYFEHETSRIAQKFRDWDEIQSTKTMSKLPEIVEWQDRGHAILTSMRTELMK